MAKKEYLPVVRLKRDSLPVVRAIDSRLRRDVVSVKAMTPIELIGSLQDSIRDLNEANGRLEKRVREVEARLVRSGA